MKLLGDGPLAEKKLGVTGNETTTKLIGNAILALLLAGANRDPSAFSDPNRLDLGALVTRLPGLRLADAKIRWSSNTVLRGNEALQLAW